MYQHYAKYIFDRCGYIETLALYPAEGISLLDSIPMYCIDMLYDADSNPTGQLS